MVTTLSNNHREGTGSIGCRGFTVNTKGQNKMKPHLGKTLNKARPCGGSYQQPSVEKSITLSLDYCDRLGLHRNKVYNMHMHNKVAVQNLRYYYAESCLPLG